MRWVLGPLCLILLVAGLPGETPATEEIIDVAMVTWRGETDAERGFVEGLKKSGLPVMFHMYDAGRDPARLEEIIGQVESSSARLVYVFGTTATQRVLRRIRERPVVFNIVSRPVATGIIKSWKSSGNNATGASCRVPVLHQLRALKKVVDYKKLGIIYNPREPNSVIQRDQVRQLEPALGFALVELRILDPKAVSETLSGLEDRVDAVYLPADSTVKSLGRKILQQVNGAGIPSLTALESMVEKDGALLGLVPNYYQLGRLAADKAVRVLHGEPPSRIPSSTLGYFQIHVNMVTAQKTGVHIPTSLLVIADRIVRTPLVR